MLTILQKKAAQAIINIFETSKAQGDYSKVTIITGDNGHLTYGRAQTTLASGNLYLLIKAYCETDGAEFARECRWYLPRLAKRDIRLDTDGNLHALLRKAGEDPVMQDAQDEFFDRVYWQPSVQLANAVGITTALGVAVVYDSNVHGSWRAMRDRTFQSYGTVQDLTEKVWVKHYVTIRREWLATHKNLILRKTVYRMDSLLDLVLQPNWPLDLPFYVRGVRIDHGALEPLLPRASAEPADLRILFFDTPAMFGDDVKAVQNALVQHGQQLKIDGIFGERTEKAVKQFQAAQHLRVDGIVGPATRTALGL